MSFKALLVLSIIVIGLIPLASAQYMGNPNEAEESKIIKTIKVVTDKKEYTPNQTITFTFSSDTFYKGRYVEVLISSPYGSIASKNNYLIESENPSFKITENLKYFTETGTYKVIVGYDNARAETSFNLTVPNSVAPQPPEPVLNDSFVYEKSDPNEISPQKEIMNLKEENQKLREDVVSLSKKLDSLNAILLEQNKVLLDLAKTINDIKNTVAEVFHFNVFA